MQTKLKITEYTLPEFWACNLMHGDESGLDCRDLDDIEAFLAKAKAEHGGALVCIDVGEPEFRRRNDANEMGGTCCLFTFHVAGRAAE